MKTNILADYLIYFKEILNFNEKRRQAIANGKNDYNIITSLLRQSDEVRLHSRFIFSLINPAGRHYKGSMFLKLLIDAVNITGFNYEYALVKRESDGIDLYITDGNIHIIIENKIFAKDQYKQIERYIKTVIENYISETLSSEEIYEKIYVLYLTPGKRKPSKESLGDWSFRNDHTLGYIGLDNKYDGFNIRYKNITYENEISIWIENIFTMENLGQNLSYGIESYQDVLKRLTKTKGSTLMTIQEYLLDDKNIENLRMSGDIYKAFESIRGRILYKFFNNIEGLICSKGFCSANNTDNLKHFVYSLDQCNKWYETGKAKEHYIGTYFQLDECIKVGIMAASEILHIVLICSPKIYDELLKNNAKLFNNYKKREWNRSNKTFHYYSKPTEFNFYTQIHDAKVLTLLSDRESTLYATLLKDTLSIADTAKGLNLNSDL